MASPYRYIGTNERGQAVGSFAPNAKLSERDVELIHQLHEGDPKQGIKKLGYQAIALKFDVCPNTIKNVIIGKHYGQMPKKWRKVQV